MFVYKKNVFNDLKIDCIYYYFFANLCCYTCFDKSVILTAVKGLK